MTTIDPNTPSPNNSTPSNVPAGGRPGRHRSRAKNLLLLTAVLAGGAVLGSAATKAFSHGGFGHGMRGWHHAGFMGGSGPIDPARMDERIERGLKHFAVEADATPDQTQKLTAIAKAAAKDLLPHAREGRRRPQASLGTDDSDHHRPGPDREAARRADRPHGQPSASVFRKPWQTRPKC